MEGSRHLDSSQPPAQLDLTFLFTSMGLLYHLLACCSAFTTLFPKLVCYGFYIWAGFTYVWQISLSHIGGLAGVLMALMGLFLTIGGMISYYMTVSLTAGSALHYPELKIKFHDEDQALSDINDETMIKYLETGAVAPPPTHLLKYSFTVKGSGILRYCNKCRIWKPDRCHHCSSCKKCMLKMDHHCPWFASCIGYKNHKFFIQFLSYTVIFSAICCWTSFCILWNFFFEEKYLHHYFSINWILLFIFGAAFALAVCVFDAFSIYQMVTNKTTIETYDYTRFRINLDRTYDDYYRYSNKPNSDQYGNLYNMGKAENWKYVMGNSWLEWCLPIANRPTTNDYYFKNGLCYPVNQKIYDELVYNSRLQLQLSSELKNMRMRRIAEQEMALNL